MMVITVLTVKVKFNNNNNKYFEINFQQFFESKTQSSFCQLIVHYLLKK